MAKAVKSVVKGAVNVVKGVVKAVGSIVSGVVKAVGKVVSTVVNFVASPFLGALGVPDASSKTSEEQRQQGVLIQTQGSYVNLPVIYGYRKIAGTVVYAETGAEENKYLWVAYALAEGPVEGLREVFIDDVQMPADTAGKLNAGQIVDITDSTSKYAGRVRLQFFPGVFHSNPASSQVAGLSILKDSPSWKNTNHWNGVAVLFARYEWKKIVTQTDSDNNPFGGNIPQIQVSMLGRRVANLFQSGIENTEYGVGGYAERYSFNPAECLLDYLRNPRYGKGLTNSEIDWTSFKISANKCATQVQYILGTTGPILTLHHVVDTGQTIFSNVKTILTHMRGYLPYVQGKYKLKIEDAGNETSITSGSANIVAAFTNDGRTSTSWTTGTRNIMSDITYTGIDRSSKYNSVSISYVDPDQKWSVQQVVYPETESERQTYITADGGRENKGEFTFGGITNYAIAKDFAKLIFNKSRWQDTCSFTGDSSCFDLEPGDNIYIDSKILRFGLEPSASAIPWRIISIKLNNDYTFEIGCVRNPDFLYPHTSVGAIDTVVPTYVPKGASIYYPDPKRTPPVGLVSPNSAPYTPATGSTGDNTGGSTDGNTGGNTTTNPPTTIVPGGTGAGGGTNGTAGGAVAVGSISLTNLNIASISSGRIEPGMYISGTGVQANTRVVYQVNGNTGGVGGYQVDKTQTVAVGTTLTFSLTASQTNTPNNPPVVPPLTNTINITRLSFQLENGSVYAIMEFNQPNHVMYAGTLFYYRSTLDSYFRTYENTDVPGPGAKISAKIGPLVNGSRIELIARVKYSTGEFSTTIAKTAFNASATDPASDPTEYTEVVASGWALPTDVPANSRDTVMNNSITDTTGAAPSSTILNSGVPYSPRRMRITTRQNIIANGLAKYNYYIKGFNIYYKQSDQTVWRTAYYNFPTGYQEGQLISFNSWETTPTMNLGVAFNTTTTAVDPGRRQKYDIILRYSYTDGTESTYQMRKMETNTEYDTGLLSFNPFYGGTPIQFTELVSDYVNAYGFVTDVTAGPGFISDPLAITFGINGIFANTTTLYGNSLGTGVPQAVIYVDPPVASNQPDWAGIRLIKRKFGGTDQTTDFLGISPTFGSGTYQIKTPVDYTGTTSLWTSATYEYVLIPLVYTATGGATPQEANTAFYFGGVINTTDPTLGSSKNWLQTLAPTSYATATAKSKLGTISNTILKDVGITSVAGTLYAPSGVIQDPRELQFTITQSATDSYTAASITGVKMYYRALGNQYYSYASKTVTLTPGSASASFRTSTMTPAPEFGGPAALPTVYDIIFRITFTDGTESTKELRTQANLISGGTAGFAQYATANSNILTVDQAPPGTFNDPRNYNFTLQQVFYSNTTGKIRANIVNITETYVSAVKIRYRQIVIGTNPAYLTWSDDTIKRDGTGQTYFDWGTGIVNNTEYEVVITPVVRYNSQRQEANNSWYGRGLVTRDTSLIDAMRFQQINTNVALDRLVTTLAQDAGATTILVAPSGWRALTVISGSITHTYAQLKFTKSHISDYHGVDIYRRDFRPLTGTIYTEYAGIGRWERCATVTDATHAPDGNGVVTVNMRMPITANEMNSYYAVTGGQSPQLFFSTPYNSLALATVVGSNNAISGPQYLVVVKTAGGSTESTRCMLLPILGAANVEYYTPLINSDTTGTYIKNTAELNNTTVGKLRNLTLDNCEFTATISATTMTVSAVSSGTLKVGQLIRNSTDTLKADPITGKPLPVFITALVSGSGGAGTYTLSQSITLGTATSLSAQFSSRTTVPASNIIRSGTFASNAFNGSTLYTLPPTTPTCI